ncbi:unnamed protein product [Rhizoctonia solani]|uniref:Ricin B lectin domain-containing protein n=1 Tax=Rhizoctonia solani TaxID=456999 RepID=A0A8H3E1A0_9AGAM|nr:unnamed protein product [Rhizoctonia solani]
MANVEPGIYRIVNLARNKALRVPNESPDTIASWHAQDESNQKWLVQRISGGYRFKNCGHGRYLSVHDTQCNSRVHHGLPTTWKIIPRAPGGYLIQLETIDRVLDLHDRGEVYIWPANDAEPQKAWKFEKLGPEAGGELGEVTDDTSSGKAGGDPGGDKPPFGNDGSPQRGPPPPSLSPIHEIQVAQQAKEIQSLQEQLFEKEQEMERLRTELELIRSQESSQVMLLSERVVQLEELVERLFEQESKRPNNAA